MRALGCVSLAASLIAVVAIALVYAEPASAAGLSCSGTAKTSAEPGMLSSPIVIELRCDTDASVTVTLPGGDSATFDVAANVQAQHDAGRAYVCLGQAPAARLSAQGGGGSWSGLMLIAGVTAPPDCNVILREGETAVRWTGPRTPILDAFAGRTTPALPSAESTARGDVIPGLAVWANPSNVSWQWRVWGYGAPPALFPLTHLEPGVTYHVLSDVERAWTFPPTSGSTSAGGSSSGASVFDGAQVVSFYGYPGVPVMGILGAYTPEQAATEVTKWARHFDALNGSRTVVPALHLIVAVAQADAGDGTYLGRLNDATIQRYVDVTRERGMLLFLDVQVGWSDPLVEVRRLERFLREPHVHVALDPEYATERYGEAPGVVIGSLDATEVNAVQHYLAGIVRQHRLPPKVLVLHQFLDSMLLDRGSWASVPEVELTVDMDGFGPDRLKLEKYELFSLAPEADRAAIKLFFEWDEPLITPERLQRLPTPPDLIIYQ